MTEIKFRVTGWKAVIVLIAVAAFLGYRYNALRTTLATEAADELRFWLAAGKSLPGTVSSFPSSAPGETRRTWWSGPRSWWMAGPLRMAGACATFACGTRW